MTLWKLPVVRQVQGPLQSEFSTECGSVLPVLISSILHFLKVIHQLLTPSSSSSRHFYPSPYPTLNNCFRRLFLRNMWPIPLNFLLFNVFRLFLSFLSLCNTWVTKCESNSKPSQCSHPTTQRPTTATNHIQQNRSSTPNALTRSLFSWRWA